MEPVSVLVADGQNVRGVGTRLYLDSHGSGGFEVVGHAVDTEDALRLSIERGPDVVVLDPAIERHGGSALWLCLALKLHEARAPKLVLFAGVEEIPGGDAWDFYETSGAESFVEAGEEMEVLLDVMSRTVEGERLCCGI